MPEHTIAENLSRLITAKTDIANAITTMGGVVGENDGFEEFPADILGIPKGSTMQGRSATITIVNGTTNSYYGYYSYDGHQLIIGGYVRGETPYQIMSSFRFDFDGPLSEIGFDPPSLVDGYIFYNYYDVGDYYKRSLDGQSTSVSTPEAIIRYSGSTKYYPIFGRCVDDNS